MNTKILQFSLVILVTMGFSKAWAQNGGDIDTSFGMAGFTLTQNIKNTSEVYLDMITLSDDKIVMVGYTDAKNQNIIVARLLADGTPDTEFGEDGILEIDAGAGMNDEAWGVKEAADGKLLITGVIISQESWDGYIMSITADGKIDETFGSKGSGFTKFNAGDMIFAAGREIEVIDGNTILVGGFAQFDGQSDMCVFKFTQGGGVAASFAKNGVASVDIDGDDDEVNAMVVDEKGSIFLAGRSNGDKKTKAAIVKLTSFGTPTSFGGTGHFTHDQGSGVNQINDIYVDGNDNIVAVGNEGLLPNINGMILRVTSEGKLDESFGQDGIQSSDPGTTTSMYLMNAFPTEDGGILVTGYTTGAVKQVYAYMMKEDGKPNADFSEKGHVSHSLTISPNSLNGKCAALQSDGAILIGGDVTSDDFEQNRLFIVRLLPVQEEPESIGELALNSAVIYPNPAREVFFVQTEGIVERVELISLQGQVVFSWRSSAAYAIPSSIEAGTYLLKVYAEDAIEIGRLYILK